MGLRVCAVRVGVLLVGGLLGAGMLASALVQSVAQPVVPQPKAAARSAGPMCQPLPEPASGANETPPASLLQPQADVCILAHVYDVVELADGTRFLDVCSTEVPDERCRFLILSLPEDREEVGDLGRFRGKDIRLRGTLRRMHGRMGIVLSHNRQFEGGPEKFRPNPKLLRGFNGQTDRMPVHDPNLRSSGRPRAFMNSHEREAVPGGGKP